MKLVVMTETTQVKENRGKITTYRTLEKGVEYRVTRELFEELLADGKAKAAKVKR